MITRTLTCRTVHGRTSPNDASGKPITVDRENEKRQIVPVPIACDVTAIFADESGENRLELHITDWAEAEGLVEGAKLTLTLG